MWAIAAGVLLLTLAGCSANGGKLTGKWQAKGGDLPDGAILTIDFAPDGKLTYTLEAPDHKFTKTATGTWALGTGNTVYFRNLSQEIAGRRDHVETITVDEDGLKMTDSDGKSSLRLKKV
jgi:hypothetical protein